MKIGSLFDGIGGWPLAAVKFGAIPVWASEIEAFPTKVTEHHFPKMKQLGDITGVHGYDIEPVDVICMGSPCQDLSVAGKREGLAGARSGLFMDAVRIVREMREATNGKYPRFVVWENVPGAFSSNKRNDFRAVLEEITESQIPIPKSGRWATAGMVRSNKCEVAWRVLDAQYWGVPQRRKRIFLVADFGGQCAAEILFKPEGLSGNITESRCEGQGFAGNATDSIRDTDTLAFNTTQITSPKNGNNPRWNDPCRCLAATDHPPAVIFKSSMIDENTPNSIGAAGFKLGQGIKAHGIGWQEEVSPTLSAMDSGNKPAVAMWDMTHTDEVMLPVKDGIVPTLNARMGTGGNQVPVIQEPVYCVGNGQLDQAKLSDKVGALNCMHDQQALIIPYQTKIGCLNARDYKGIGSQYVSEDKCIVEEHYKVRRITPTECERLQGLPDGYTLIDDKKCSDSARYKALGNGMAQPCADFVMQRIVEVSVMKDEVGLE